MHCKTVQRAAVKLRHGAMDGKTMKRRRGAMDGKTVKRATVQG